MVQMATPWLHPETGFYYIRRQIPEELRPAFGNKRLHKVSLRTKDPARAAILFATANGDLEASFEKVRLRLSQTGSPTPSPADRARELVLSYFTGPELAEGGLDGPERLELARLEIDRGLRSGSRSGPNSIFVPYPVPVDEDRWWALSNNAAIYRAWDGRRPVGRAIGSIWKTDDADLPEGQRRRQIDRLMAQIARHHGCDVTELPASVPDVIAAFLDEQPVGPRRQQRDRPVGSRLRPDMTLSELFVEWNAKLQPSEQTAHEFEQSLKDFVDLHGDLPVSQITSDDLLDYRDEAAILPRSMPRADRTLAFTERVRKFADAKSPKISPATLKKRVGAIQAFLVFAFNQKWIAKNVGVDIPIDGYSKLTGIKRHNFEEEDLNLLFTSPLFTSPSSWQSDRKVADATLYWLFLLALTTGARIEEVGQALVADVKAKGRVLYIDIDDYIEDDVDASKSVKTPGSRRVIPIHDRLKALGFDRYVASIRESGSVQLFPDLVAGQFGKHTKEASRVANRLIDKLVTRNRRLVFHSFRHQFKDFALEAGITERVVDQITGHAPTTIGGLYGSGVRLPALNKFMHAIEWGFIDWNAISEASLQASWNALAPSAAAEAQDG